MRSSWQRVVFYTLLLVFMFVVGIEIASVKKDDAIKRQLMLENTTNVLLRDMNQAPNQVVINTSEGIIIKAPCSINIESLGLVEGEYSIANKGDNDINIVINNHKFQIVSHQSIRVKLYNNDVIEFQAGEVVLNYEN